MLKTHLDQIESELLEIAKRPSSSGHSLHKGTPREAFIRRYLEEHLSTMVAFGTGEIINSNSRPNERRNQLDIVIYRRHYPKLEFGGDISAFFAESVVATIEVKSKLTKTELIEAMKAAQTLKRLERDSASTWIIGPGYKQPGILSFVLAYDGPVNMKTIKEWLPEIEEEIGINPTQLGNTLKERNKIVAPSIDGIFVLGKGSVIYDTLPITLVDDSIREENPQMRWIAANLDRGSLLLLFSVITAASCGVVFHGFNPLPYLANIELSPDDVDYQ